MAYVKIILDKASIIL